MNLVVGIPNPEVRGVGIVFKGGYPSVTVDWLRGLTPQEREAVDRALAVRGFRINGLIIEEVADGNS